MGARGTRGKECGRYVRMSSQRFSVVCVSNACSCVECVVFVGDVQAGTGRRTLCTMCCCVASYKKGVSQPCYFDCPLFEVQPSQLLCQCRTVAATAAENRLGLCVSMKPSVPELLVFQRQLLHCCSHCSVAATHICHILVAHAVVSCKVE